MHYKLRCFRWIDSLRFVLVILEERHQTSSIRLDQVADCEPILIEMPGWHESTFGLRMG